jgi:hypothetical protein
VLGQFWSNFLGLLGNLVACLLKLIILVVDYFLEGERLLRVTVSREGVQDFRQLRLTDDRVLNLTDIFVCEDDVGLVNSEFKGQEQDRQCYLVTLTNLYLLHFAEVWFRNSIVILLATLGNFIFLSLSVGGLGGFSILLLVCVFLVALILNLNVEDDVLGECIFDLQVNLESLVELCWLLNDLNWIALIHIRDQLKNKGSRLNVSLLLIGEDDFTFDESWDARLETNRERNTLAWFDPDLFLFDGEVWWADQFDPVGDRVLWRIRQLDILGDKVA